VPPSAIIIAVFRLQTDDLEGLAREVGQCDPNDHLRHPTVVGQLAFPR